MKKLFLLLLMPLVGLAQPTPPPAGSSAAVMVNSTTHQVVYPPDFLVANPAGPSLDIVSVATNTDKLALTDLEVGQRVKVTGEGNRIEVYLGEDEAVTGRIVVSGAGTSGVNGFYYEDGTAGGKTRYTLQGGTTGDDSILWVPNDWRMFSGGTLQYSSEDSVATPDLVTTWTVNIGDTPVPTVAAETLSNWVTLYEGGKRLPMFEIQVPVGSGFTDFELKASVTNFTGATAADKFAYIYHSPDPDLAQSDYDVKPLVWFTNSSATTIVHKQQPAAASIYSTLPDANSEVGSIFVIVRGPEVWKWEDNPDVLWAFVFFDSLGPEEDGATPARQIWRAIRPVKWITEDKIPLFLTQD